MDKKSTSIQKKFSHKKSNVKKTNERHNSKSDDLGQIKKSVFKFESSDEDASISNTICGNDLMKEVAKNVKLSTKWIQLIFLSLAHFVMLKLARVLGL